MPPPPIPTGSHTPITNVIASESIVQTEQIAWGSVGDPTNVVALAAGATEESIPKPEFTFEVAEAPSSTAPDLTGLLDAGVASFGLPPKLESVFGPDERVRITNTTAYPWRIMASLLITAADNSSWIGTGWFISPRTLITAGHCVYIKHSDVPGRNGWVKKIQVMPGRDGDTLPFGGISSTEFATVKGWGEQGLPIYDYGAIFLPSAFAADLGTLSYGVLTDAQLLASVANVAGYPWDKPSGTLWHDKRQVGSVNPDKVFYAADTEGGQSGAPVYVVRDSQRIGVAIHAYGGQTSNSGTRISSQVFSNLENWKRT